MADQPAGGPRPLVIAGLLRQIREHVPQVGAREADPAGLGGKDEQCLHDREGNQFGIAELRGHARCRLRALRST